MKERALRQTASHVLAAAIFEMFPMVDLWQSEATDVGFVCECFFPHPVHPDTLPLIEQRMKQIIQQARPIRLLEMVPVSAAALLKKEGHKEQVALLEDLEERGALVELIEIGPFHQLTDSPHLESTAQLKAFVLSSLKILPNQGLRIEGVVAQSKEELKIFLKKIADFEENNYQQIGAQLGFWVYKPRPKKPSFLRPEEITSMAWLQKGIEARQKIENLFFQEAPLVECRGPFEECLTIFQKNCRLLKGDSTKDLRSSLFAVQQLAFFKPEEFAETVNSFLHLTYKILIMLGFDCWTRVLGKRSFWKGVEHPNEERVERLEGDPCIDWMVEDSLMRPVQIISMRKIQEAQGKKEALICEAFIERILVLMLEKNLRTSFF